MTTITYPSSAAIVAPASTVCAVSSHWGSGWTTVTDLHCRRLTLCTGEGISSAECHWRFGYRLGTGETTPTLKAVQSVNPRTYLRVIVYDHAGAEAYRWTGLWSRATKGEQTQTFAAVGIETFLDLPCLDLPWVDNTGTVRWAGRGLTFGQQAGRRRVPNRSANKYNVNGKWAYCFQPQEDLAQSWSTRDAVEMLLAAAAPRDENDDVIFRWGLVGRENLPDFDEVSLPTHGRSWLSIMRSLLPKSRLCGWHVVHDDVGPYVSCWTYAASAVPMYDADGNVVGYVPDNADQIQINLAADQSANSSLSVAASHVCDQVVVTGAPRKIVFTVSKADETLDADWPDDAETAYLAAATEADDYPPEAEVSAREQRDRDARASQSLRSVYSYFAPPDDWVQKSGDGQGGETLQPIALDEDDAQFKLLSTELTFEDRLPLLTGYEYDGSKIADYDGLGGHQAYEITDAAHDHLPILVAVRIHTADPEQEEDVDRWVWAHELGRGGAVEQTDDDVSRRWSLDVRPLPSRAGLGLELRVQGEQQHVLAATEFEDRDDAVRGDIAWEEDLVATVCLQETRAVEVRFPENVDLQSIPNGGTGKYQPLGDSLQRLYLEVPHAELVDVRPNTVVAIEAATGTLLTTDGGYVIDDRPLLRLLAERAYDWHSQFRYQLQYQTGFVTSDLGIGQLVTQCTDQAGVWPVGSVVTEITLEFPVGGGGKAPKAKCAVTTQFAEMDVLRLV